MPPRFAYWTILIDGKATAFRAHDREELLPTMNQLRRKNAEVTLRYFARGKLWDSPEQAQWAGKNLHASGEKRGRDWRPGGAHKDPRARKPEAKKAGGGHAGGGGARAASGAAGADRGRFDQRGPDRKPTGGFGGKRDRPPRPSEGKRPWQPKPGAGGQRPWNADRGRSDRQARSDSRGPAAERPLPPPPPAGQARPWQDRPRDLKSRDQKSRGQRPRDQKAFGKPRTGGQQSWNKSGEAGRRPWTPKPQDGDRRPWKPKPREDERRSATTRDDRRHDKRAPRGGARPDEWAAKDRRKRDLRGAEPRPGSDAPDERREMTPPPRREGHPERPPRPEEIVIKPKPPERG